MFIVWGRKIRRRTAGYVADYCPLCRAKRAFELQDVRSAAHVYYVSLGSGKLVGHERKCEECGTSFQANPTSYASVSRTRASPDELERLTFPNLDAAIKEQVALDERIRRQRLTPAERQSLIKAPFVYLSPKVERRFAATQLDARAGIALAAGVALVFLGGLGARQWALVAPELVLLVCVAGGIALVVWQVLASGSRFMRREIVPVLARSLKPLEPTQEEIELVLKEFRRVKHKIGRKLRVADLMAGMRPQGI